VRPVPVPRHGILSRMIAPPRQSKRAPAGPDLDPPTPVLAAGIVGYHTKFRNRLQLSDPYSGI